MKKRNYNEQALINKKELERQIEVCTLKEEFGNVEAARLITQRGRPMQDKTVCQIYATYQVFHASVIIQELFYSGRISWNRIYKTRGIYDRGTIKTGALLALENTLLMEAGMSRDEIQTLVEIEEKKDKIATVIHSNISDYYKTLDEEVQKSRSDQISRRARLKVAPSKPDILEITHTVFKRNPDVIAEVLERAQGFCERCKKIAPFIRKSDNTPYLEVHHLIPLAQDGEDTVENAIALCPNCHREMHYGIHS